MNQSRQRLARAESSYARKSSWWQKERWQAALIRGICQGCYGDREAAKEKGRQAAASEGREMRFSAFALFLALPLCDCGQNKHAALAECQMKATEVYPNKSGRETELGEAGDYTFLCMEAKGYVSNLDLKRCPLGRGWVGELDEGCYRQPRPWE